MPHICVNCKNSFEGKFCNNCGEKIVHQSDYSLSRFLEQTVDIFTHFDSKFLKSIAYTVTKPGFLTEEHIIGRRVRYAKPLQLFIVMSAVFYILNHNTNVNMNMFNTPLRNQVRYFSYSETAKEMVIAKIKQENISDKTYEENFDKLSDSYSKTLIILMVPVLAFPLWILFRRKAPYYAQHLIFSLHFYSAILLLVIGTIFLTLLVVQMGRWGWFNPQDYIGDGKGDLYYSGLGVLFMSNYFSKAYRRLYNIHWAKNILITTASIFGFYYILVLYRFILFGITFYTL